MSTQIVQAAQVMREHHFKRIGHGHVTCTCGETVAAVKHPEGSSVEYGMRLHVAAAIDAAGLLRGSPSRPSRYCPRCGAHEDYPTPMHLVDCPPATPPQPPQTRTATADHEVVHTRLLALADDLAGIAPYTASVLRAYAAEVANHIDDAHLAESVGHWPALVQQYAERERQVRELTLTLDGEYPDPTGVIAGIVRRFREILDPTEEGTCPGGC